MTLYRQSFLCLFLLIHNLLHIQNNLRSCCPFFYMGWKSHRQLYSLLQALKIKYNRCNKMYKAHCFHHIICIKMKLLRISNLYRNKNLLNIFYIDHKEILYNSDLFIQVYINLSVHIKILENSPNMYHQSLNTNSFYLCTCRLRVENELNHNFYIDF